MQLILSGLTIALAVAWAVPGFAHHSHSNYFTSEYTPLVGKVVEFHWVNPHTWIYLEVVGSDGETVEWALEGASPATEQPSN